eukprot:Selendium_serpulae@DN7994_c0_g1_i1.p1
MVLDQNKLCGLLKSQAKSCRRAHFADDNNVDGPPHLNTGTFRYCQRLMFEALHAVASRLHWCILYLLSFAISVGVKYIPPKTQYFDLASEFQMTLWSVALLPQLHMFRAHWPRRISVHVGIFVVCQMLLRITAIGFWCTIDPAGGESVKTK